MEIRHLGPQPVRDGVIAGRPAIELAGNGRSRVGQRTPAVAAGSAGARQRARPDRKVPWPVGPDGPHSQTSPGSVLLSLRQAWTGVSGGAGGQVCEWERSDPTRYGG